ncbi:protein Iojap-related protein, mitochondrial [Tanacetum coccineum]
MFPSLRRRYAQSITSNIFNRSFCLSSLINQPNKLTELLKIEEVEKILKDVRADDVKIIPVDNKNEFASFIVVATGKSQWHVRNIAQALIYKVEPEAASLPLVGVGLSTSQPPPYTVEDGIGTHNPWKTVLGVTYLLTYLLY